VGKALGAALAAFAAAFGIGKIGQYSLEAGARLMTLENGLRFLADHLNGDKYFKIHRPGQNLDRARAQFALLEDMERQQAEMRSLLEKLYH
jgi:hypothetical protein